MYMTIIFIHRLLKSASETSDVLGETKHCSGFQGHKTKIPTMHIFCENPYKLFSGTKGSMTLWPLLFFYE